MLIGFERASDLLLLWDWLPAGEMVIFGDNGQGDSFGLWVPRDGGARPVWLCRSARCSMDARRRWSGNDLDSFVRCWTDYYTQLNELCDLGDDGFFFLRDPGPANLGRWIHGPARTSAADRRSGATSSRARPWLRRGARPGPRSPRGRPSRSPTDCVTPSSSGCTGSGRPWPPPGRPADRLQLGGVRLAVELGFS